MQLLDKGALLIKDVKLLDPKSYSDFVYILVALMKRESSSMYISFSFHSAFDVKYFLFKIIFP